MAVDPNNTQVVYVGTERGVFRSSDGAATWSLSTTAGSIGQTYCVSGAPGSPNLVFAGTNGGGYRSTDGGGTWSLVLNSGAVHDYAVDALSPQTVYAGVSSGVYKSTDSGATWSASGLAPNHVYAVAVDPTTSGSTAHLALTYYYYPNANCIATTCELNVGFVSSEDGGSTWTEPVQLAGPMKLASLPTTTLGVMVGDYISTSYVNGLAFGAFAVANPASGTVFDEAIYTTVNGLMADRNLRRFSSAGQRPVPNVRSNRPVRTTPLKIR